MLDERQRPRGCAGTLAVMLILGFLTYLAYLDIKLSLAFLAGYLMAIVADD